jgi:putative ABC transport system substrate-binding protein
MNRREFLLLLSSAMAVARPLHAQQKTMPVIGYLNPNSPGPNAPNMAAFRRGLNDAGYVEGQNVAIEYRWAEGRLDRLPALAADLVSRKVDLIVTTGGFPAALAAKNATSRIPVVFSNVGDPVVFGLVSSLAHPGGNLTGFGSMAFQLAPKRLELLCELVPQAGVIALLVNPDNPSTKDVIGHTQEAAQTRGVNLAVLKATTEGDIVAAFASLDQLQAGGLDVEPDALFFNRREQLAELASHHSIPAVSGFRQFAAAGGLISYRVDTLANTHQAGIYAGRILKGEKPADLPVQEPTRFELVVNLKTAKALGLTVPPSILARADEVIE